MKLKPIHRARLFKWIGAALIAAGGLSACEGYDLAKNDPSWLGSSIYDYLQSEGNYTNTVRLIDDLDYAEVLAKTGSKTLFVADDAAFERFFKKNNWGVKSYDQLTKSQKKLLLFGSMINNSCQVAYLSSSEGPTEGDCMRRFTATSQYDSVPVLKAADMPDNIYWQRHKERGSIVCMNDITAPPMIHLIEDFLNNKLITNEDCNFLNNHTYDRKPGDADVNGVKMEVQNIKCSNGFVHKMAEVITPLPNMADLINQKANTSEYAKLLNRYCAPYYAGDFETREYNRIYDTNIDSLFEKRFFSERSRNGEPVDLSPDKGPVNGTLKFDPGWNQFYSATTNTTTANVALQENMGVMLVPSNKALEDYWNEGAGMVLKEYYGSWDAVPDKVVSKMLNVNMLNSFVGSVPSKFHTVLNDANDELNLTEESVDSVFFACNGVVYLTNKVFNPVAYISVTFPALIKDNLSILYWAVEQLGYDVYLNSQQTKYSLFVPSNESLISYVDPCSYGKTSTQLFRFYYKPTAQTEREKVKAAIYNYNVETGQVGDSIGEATYDQITNRLEDILNTHIVIGNVEDGNTFYRTKGGSMIKVVNASAGENGMTVQGGKQIEEDKSIKVTAVYDQSKDGNGKTYILDSEPIMTAQQSVFNILSEHDEFIEFTKLLRSSQFIETKRVIGNNEHGCPTENINLFNTYKYTVYVPTNRAILELQQSGKLPTWEMVEMANNMDDSEAADSLTNVIENFIKYHIQDNSFFIGEGNDSGEYETAAYRIEKQAGSKPTIFYYKLKTTVSNDGITVTDGTGKSYKVLKDNGLYNIMAREYQYDAPDASNAKNIYTSSFAVIHQIDGALQYKP